MALALSDSCSEEGTLRVRHHRAECVGIRGERCPASLQYYSESPTYDQIHQWITGPVNERILQIRLQAAALDAGIVRAATRPVPVRNLGLVKTDHGYGDVVDAAATLM
jgi:hypothetical protein